MGARFSGPAAVGVAQRLGGLESDFVDNGAYTGRLGYAHSTVRPGSARHPSILPGLSQGLRP